MPVTQGYSRRQIALHWIIALLILTMFFSGEVIHEFGHVLRDNPNATPSLGVPAHIFAGVAILLLAIWRIYLRVTRGAPAEPEGIPAIQALAAKLVHVTLYAVMVMMPVSGLVAWFGGVNLAGEAHQVMKVVLIILLILHIGAALYHQYGLKNGLIRRMMKAG